MNKLAKMHLMAGTTALISILYNVPKIIAAFQINWQTGTSLISSLAIGGYFLGCVISGLANFAYMKFRK